MRLSRMVARGTEGISLTQKRDYGRHIPAHHADMVRTRWLRLGIRFRKSMEKVVGVHAEAR